jgi:hypothetical protein
MCWILRMASFVDTCWNDFQGCYLHTLEMTVISYWLHQQIIIIIQKCLSHRIFIDLYVSSLWLWKLKQYLCKAVFLLAHEFMDYLGSELQQQGGGGCRCSVAALSATARHWLHAYVLGHTSVACQRCHTTYTSFTFHLRIFCRRWTSCSLFNIFYLLVNCKYLIFFSEDVSTVLCHGAPSVSIMYVVFLRVRKVKC